MLPTTLACTCGADTKTLGEMDPEAQAVERVLVEHPVVAGETAGEITSGSGGSVTTRTAPRAAPPPSARYLIDLDIGVQQAPPALGIARSVAPPAFSFTPAVMITRAASVSAS